jgi:cathepsin A (carboxypeptidase C)
MFEARENPKDAPLILWLTGGPGCSSMVALLSENGPCTVAEGGMHTIPNKYSWNQKANIMFLDQPVGTGFSYGNKDEYDTNEAEVSDDLYHFMQEFFKAHTEYHKNEFYVFGESYAGHYVPAVSHRIYEGNKAVPKGDGAEYIAMRGFGIGNGLTDPEIQYQYYPQMAFKPGHAPGAVDASTFQDMQSSVAACTKSIKHCQTDTSACPEAKDLCSMKLVVPVQSKGINVYDMRKQCSKPPLCYRRFGDVETYLNQKRVMKTLGVHKTWTTCNFEVNADFSEDWMKNYASKIPDMLSNGYSALIYAGDVDFICNWMGNKAWTMKMDWSGHDDFNNAKDVEWKVDGDVKGEVRHAGRLNFVRIHNAGHMVPMDQPKAALAMLDQFLVHKTLVVTE